MGSISLGSLRLVRDPHPSVPTGHAELDAAESRAEEGRRSIAAPPVTVKEATPEAQLRGRLFPPAQQVLDAKHAGCLVAALDRFVGARPRRMWLLEHGK